MTRHRRQLPQRSLRAGLVHYWPFARNGAVDLKDAFAPGGACDWTNGAGTPARAAGPSNNIPDSLALVAASSQRIDGVDLSNLSILGNWTLDGWFYFTTDPGATFSFLDKWVGTGNQREWAISWNKSTNRFNFSVTEDGTIGTSRSAISAAAPTDATWYYLVCSVEAGSGRVRLYVNNVEGTSSALANTPPTSINGTAIIRSGGAGLSAQVTNGRLADIGIWNRVLSRREREWRYNNGAGRRLLPLT